MSKAIRVERFEEAMKIVRNFMDSNRSMLGLSECSFRMRAKKYGEFAIEIRDQRTGVKQYVLHFFSTGSLRKITDRTWGV